VTGVGLLSPIGSSLDEVSSALRSDVTGVRIEPSFGAIEGLSTRLAAPLPEALELSSLPRKKARSMGRVARLAAEASERAIDDSGLDRQELASGKVGLAYGSTHGSSAALLDFVRPLLTESGLLGIPSSTYLKFMSHTCAANLAILYGIRGRIIPTSAACASASLAIGYGYEAVASGKQEVMICGGAEELHYVPVGVFDILMATSTGFNDDPDSAPRPFDADRDGLVVGEGAGTLVLERLDRARARGATIHAELIGFGTTSDGIHVTSPSSDGMARAMTLALEDAELKAGDIDYVNAHATATEVGDIAESAAVAEVLGPDVPISSTKGFTGHTLGACGALEAAFCLVMMRDGFLAPSRNLDRVDPRCGSVAYVMGEPSDVRPTTVMTNNFAFGGINTSLILRTL